MLLEEEVNMTQLALNKNQITKLTQLSTKFDQVEWFILEATSDSGIGPRVLVKFNLFGDHDKDTDTDVDITDVSTW
jgi:hypothetical protein